MPKLSLYLVALLFGNGLTPSASMNWPAMTISNPAAFQGVSASEAESQMTAFVNAARSENGLQVLTPNAVLVRAARAHSREMYQRDYFSHTSPTNGLTTPMDRYKSTLGWQPTWAYLGENLFYCSEVNPELGHKCLMASPEHRDNILNPRYEQVGVGVYISPDGRFWVTELFLAQID